jgi:flavin-dependent dehydrogenase
VVVVGGGISGLSAAAKLHADGYQVEQKKPNIKQKEEFLGFSTSK